MFRRKKQDGSVPSSGARLLDFFSKFHKPLLSNPNETVRRLFGDDLQVALETVKGLKGNANALCYLHTDLRPEIKVAVVKCLVEMLNEPHFAKNKLGDTALCIIMLYAENKEDQAYAAQLLGWMGNVGSDEIAREASMPHCSTQAKVDWLRTVSNICTCLKDSNVKRVLLERLGQVLGCASQEDMAYIAWDTMVLSQVLLETKDNALAGRLIRWMSFQEKTTVLLNESLDSELGLKIIRSMDNHELGGAVEVASSCKNAVLRMAAVDRLKDNERLLSSVIEMSSFEDSVQAAALLLSEDERARAMDKRSERPSLDDVLSEPLDHLDEIFEALTEDRLNQIPQHLKNAARSLVSSEETDEGKLRAELRPYWDNSKVLEAVVILTKNPVLQHIASERVNQLIFASNLRDML